MKVEEVVTPGYLKCDAHATGKACEGEVVHGSIEVITSNEAPIERLREVDLCGKGWRAVLAAIKAKTQPVTRARRTKTEEPKE